jgi:hypothetical protein
VHESQAIVKTTGIYEVSAKSRWQHCSEIFSRPVQIVAIVAACFGSMWTIFEASASALNLTPDRLIPYFCFLAISVGVSMSWRTYRYINTCPEGLELLSKTACRIAHIQRPKWQFRFAKSVLAQLLGPIDLECRDMLDGKVFVAAERPRDFWHYLTWLQGRAENPLRMAHIGNQLMGDFVKSLESGEDELVSSARILEASVAIQRFFRASVEFERLSLAILPPEGFERLHELQFGMSQPVREAVTKLFDFLQKVCETDFRDEAQIEYKIEFGEWGNVDAYCAELDRLAPRIEQLLADEG